MPKFRRLAKPATKPDEKPIYEVVEFPSAKFRIYKSRYIQQVHDDHPALVVAEADSPAIVELPEFEVDGVTPTKIDRDLHPIEEPVREVPKPHFAKPAYHGDQVRTAPDVHGKKPQRTDRPA